MVQTHNKPHMFISMGYCSDVGALSLFGNVFRDDIGNISKINHFYIVRPISISSESPKKLYKKRLAASLRTSLIQYVVGPVGLEPTTKGL